MLNSGDVDFFHENGYVSIPHLIDAETVAALRDYYDRILTRDIQLPGDRMLGNLVRQVMVPSSEIAYFRENPALDAGRKIAQQLLECDEAEFFFDMLISKEPGQLNETPWHNDYSYAAVPVAPAGRVSSHSAVQFWIALDDVDEDNGCMQFIPGSHREPSPEHFVASGEPDDPGRLLATNDVDASKAVACPLPAGGCTVHSTGTLHFTGGNRTTDRPRRAYIFNFRKHRKA